MMRNAKQAKQKVVNPMALTKTPEDMQLPTADAEARLAGATEQVVVGSGKTPVKTAQAASKRIKNWFDQQVAKVVRLRKELA